MKKRILSGLKWTLLYLAIIFAIVEGTLWILGYRPFTNSDYTVTTNPSHPYIADSTLGIRLKPGTFTITLNNTVTFHATHQKNGERNIPYKKNLSSPEIVFLGCSFTYGYGVDDSLSFPALIQRDRPGWHIRNQAVVGYGSAQHLLQIKQLVSGEHPPKSIVVCFSEVHFIRTVLSQAYRANLRIGYRRSSTDVDDHMLGARFPYMNTCGMIEFQDWEDMYSEVWGRYTLASANFLQSKWEATREPKCDPVDITACIFKEMAALCKEKDVKFGVVFLDSSPKTRLLRSKIPEIPVCEVGFSFEAKKYTNLPYDSHPNALGHEKIERVVLSFTDKLMTE